MGQPINPYHAPQSDVAAVGVYPPLGTLEDASKGARFATLLIDWFAILVVMFMIGVVIGLLGLRLDWIGNVIGWTVMLGYYIGFEYSFAATPGKLITGSRVVREDGTKPSLGQILGRSLMRLVPFEPFSLLFGDRAWHDSASGTRVVRRN